ncbi:unnamed protein product, partial [Phaeothamnion confervicola]
MGGGGAITVGPRVPFLGGGVGAAGAAGGGGAAAEDEAISLVSPFLGALRQVTLVRPRPADASHGAPVLDPAAAARGVVALLAQRLRSVAVFLVDADEQLLTEWRAEGSVELDAAQRSKLLPLGRVEVHMSLPDVRLLIALVRTFLAELKLAREAGAWYRSPREA